MKSRKVVNSSSLLPILVPLLLLLVLSNFTCFSLENDSITKRKPVKNCAQQDIEDLFRKKDKPRIPPKRTMVLVLPIVSSNPANGFLLGVGGTVGWYWGPKETTRISSPNFIAAVTSKKQLYGNKIKQN